MMKLRAFLFRGAFSKVPAFMTAPLSSVIKQPELLKKLDEFGYETIDDVAKANFIELTRELELTSDQVNTLLKLTRGGIIESSQFLMPNRGISLSTRSLDGLFGPHEGVPPCQITEFCGESGSGKTQLCIQLAVNAQLPTSCGGLDGDCLYIDTEGGCLPARMREIARGMKERFPDLIDNDMSVLSKIHYLRIMNHMQLVALMYQLPDIIKEYPKTKLVIIDSIAFPFKLAVRPCLRDKLLRLIARTLKDIATDKKLAVVVTNQVIQDRGTKQLTPALGELWGDWCTNRMFLFRKRHARYVLHYKEAGVPIKEKIAQFCISDYGIYEHEAQHKDQTGSRDGSPIGTSWTLCETSCIEDSVEDDNYQDGALELQDEPPPRTPIPVTEKNEHKKEEISLKEKPVSDKVTSKRKHEEIQEDEGWSSEEEDDWRFLESLYSQAL